MLTASYRPASLASEARSCTLSSAQTGIGRAIAASAASSPAGKRLLDQRRRRPPRRRRDCRARLPARHASLASTISSALGAAARTARDALGIALAAELDLQQRARRRLRRGLGHCVGRAERDRVGGHERRAAAAGPRAHAPACPARFASRSQKRAVERVAGGARRHRASAAPPGRARARARARIASIAAATPVDCLAIARIGHAFAAARVAPSVISATTTCASVFAPRAMVKAPAIGQRSVRTVRVSVMHAAMPELARKRKGRAQSAP